MMFHKPGLTRIPPLHEVLSKITLQQYLLISCLLQSPIIKLYYDYHILNFIRLLFKTKQKLLNFRLFSDPPCFILRHFQILTNASKLKNNNSMTDKSSTGKKYLTPYSRQTDQVEFPRSSVI